RCGPRSRKPFGPSGERFRSLSRRSSVPAAESRPSVSRVAPRPESNGRPTPRAPRPKNCDRSAPARRTRPSSYFRLKSNVWRRSDGPPPEGGEKVSEEVPRYRTGPLGRLRRQSLACSPRGLARDFDGVGRAAFARRDDEDGFARREARDEYGVPVADFGGRGLRINERGGDDRLVEENSVRGAHGDPDSLCDTAAPICPRVA